MDTDVSRSEDGLHWQQPVDVSRNGARGIIDVLPFLYPRHDGDWALGWISTGTDDREDVVSVPLSHIAHADQQMILLVRRVHEADYSARVIPAHIPGTYLVGWVTEQGTTQTLLSQIRSGAVVG